MKADVTTLDAKKAGTVDLPEHVFGLEPRPDLLQRMVRYQLSRRQAGTHKTKGRSEIQGTTKKMYKQKGTGQARHGDRKVPQFRGGGKAFGPAVRSHAHDLPKKVRALALRHALSAKAKADALVVIEKLESKDGKTGALKKQFGKLGLGSALIIDGAEVEKNVGLAARNIPGIDVLPVQGLNVYDILRRDKLVLTRAAIDAITERFADAAKAKAKPKAKAA
ncbi:MAG: 50S ribosomal protein L4 [Hyphomicrobiales bacterium]